MAKPTKLSKEYLSDSDMESDSETVQQFTVPSGFKKVTHLKRFPKKSQEEEVWLIKLPANLDISELETLPMDNGVISLKNKKKYMISKDFAQDSSSNLSLLVPNDDKVSLSASVNSNDKSIKFDKILTVSEIANIPEIKYENIRLPRNDVVKVEGLQMRHFPTGYDAKDYELDSKKEVSKKSSKKRNNDDKSSTSNPSKKKKKDKK